MPGGQLPSALDGHGPARGRDAQDGSRCCGTAVDCAASRRSAGDACCRPGSLGGALLAIDACVPPRAGSTRYGPLGPLDANGLQLPPGFSSRVVARSGELVAATGYQWHPPPTVATASPPRAGGCTCRTPRWTRSAGSAWSASTRPAPSSVPPASSTAPTGTAPAGTPLGHLAVVRGGLQRPGLRGQPTRREPPVAHVGMGRFQHEGAAVDAARQVVYLTEDEHDGLLYRYRYDRPSDLDHWRAGGGTGRRRPGVLAAGPRPVGAEAAHPQPGGRGNRVPGRRGHLVQQRRGQPGHQVRRQGVGLQRRHPAPVGRLRLDGQPDAVHPGRRQHRGPQR